MKGWVCENDGDSLKQPGHTWQEGRAKIDVATVCCFEFSSLF